MTSYVHLRTWNQRALRLLSSVGTSCSVRELPGKWQFRRVLPGWQLVGELANEKWTFFPGTPLIYVYLTSSSI